MSASRRILWTGFKILVALGLAGLVACLVIIVGSSQYFAARGLEHLEPGDADVIIVLSAGLDREKAALDPFSRSRVETAVELMRKGVAPSILMSGGYDERLGQHLAEEMKLFAVAIGAPERQIFVEGNSISTFENARFTYQVAKQEDWRRAVIVTDDFHLLRAWTLFQFWRGPSDFEIVALAPAEGRSRASLVRQALAIGRETLAYPFNMMKIAGQIGLELIGRGDERTIR